MRRSLAVAAALALVVAGCGEAAAVREAEPFQGRWQSEGFGTYLVVDGGAVRIYEHTPISCVRVVSGSARGISNVLSLEGDRLVLDDAGRLVRYDRIDAVPQMCADPWETDDPVRSLEVLIANVEQHYAFVDELDGWEDGAAATRAMVTADTAEADLVQMFIHLLEPLRGRQVRLAVDDAELLPPDGTWPPGSGDPVADRLAEDQAAGARLTDGWELSGLDGLLSGQTAAGTPYLAIRQFALLDEDPEKSQSVLAAAVDGWLGHAETIGSPGVILDLRANPGGQDANALLVASRFVAEERTVATREVRIEGTDRFVPAGTATVRPTIQGPYEGRVVVLTGPGTAGSAEMLTLALRGLPLVTVMGSRTSGSLAPILVRALPNGWAVGLPNERVYDSDGFEWEGVGLPPDIAVSLTLSDLEAGRDPVLAAAEALLG